MAPKKPLGNVLLGPALFAILLLLGVGCAKKEAFTPYNPGLPTGSTANGTGCVNDGTCAGLTARLPEGLTSEDKDTLEKEITATGAKVYRDVNTEWKLTLSSSGTDEFLGWTFDDPEQQLHQAYVYFDGSRLSVEQAPAASSVEMRARAVERAGYAGVIEYRGTQLDMRVNHLTEERKDSLSRALIAAGAQVERDEHWNMTLSTTDTGMIQRWIDKVKLIPNIGKVDPMVSDGGIMPT